MAKFLKVKCGKCNNEQVVFSNASSPVKCLICGEELVKTTGGKSKVSAEVLEELE
jgi:small subunit ribosomal protein S27e